MQFSVNFENPLDEEIQSYYRHTRVNYQFGLNLKKNNALRFGYWDERTSNLGQALHRINEVMAEKAGLKQGLSVVDIGCGTGSSVLYLAKEFNAQVKGFTLSDWQAEEANQLFKKNKISDCCSAQVENFMKSSMEEESIDLIWDLESMIHYPEKKAFVKKIERLLVSGGKLVLTDYFLKRMPQSEKEKKWMKEFLYGWRLPNITGLELFTSWLKEAGFEIKCQVEISTNIYPSSRYLAFLALISMFHTYFLSVLGVKRNPHKWTNASATFCQFKALKSGVWGVYLVVAQKPNLSS